MKAMILAAGFGERLWPLTADRTKPALPVLGKPLVGYVAEYAARFGITDVVVNLHHEPDSVRRALGDGSKFGARLEYVHEPVILGTSGALDNARALLESETFVVINGKLVTNIDLSAAIQHHREQNALATLVLKPNAARERFSVVETRDGLVTKFAGMPSPGDINGEPPLMFTGIHIMEPRIFDYIPRGVFSDTVIDVYPRAMADGERIVAHTTDGLWYELSTLRRYLEISLALLHEKSLPIFTGANPTIGANAAVRDAILWDNVIIGAGAKVNRAVLGDNVRIPPGEIVDDAVVVCADLVSGKKVPAKALKGEVIGDNFVVPLSQ
jgi:Nucleoside-diphosphate-sugar pyrophosphorylase involved in lipopolysaccharide biosynthesis/translation initiation factor 2B, gamma/epsilon subunits (eIF-2Bgamma/eIF-2Bepsilon)